MDEKVDKEQIIRALEKLGLDTHKERFTTEIHHLVTLFSQGQTAAHALQTVSDPRLRVQLKPALYLVILRALVIALANMETITSEQASDLLAFLNTSIGAPKHTSRHRRPG